MTTITCGVVLQTQQHQQRDLKSTFKQPAYLLRATKLRTPALGSFKEAKSRVGSQISVNTSGKYEPTLPAIFLPKCMDDLLNIWLAIIRLAPFWIQGFCSYHRLTPCLSFYLSNPYLAAAAGVAAATGHCTHFRIHFHSLWGFHWSIA